MFNSMHRFVGQITVTLVARNRTAAQARLRFFANQVSNAFTDVLFADHRGEIDDYWSLIANAESQNNCSPVWFDRFEISGVAPMDDDQGSYLDPVDDSEAEAWCLYGHVPGQGLITIGTYSTRVHAEAILMAITGNRCWQSGFREIEKSTAA